MGKKRDDDQKFSQETELPNQQYRLLFYGSSIRCTIQSLTQNWATFTIFVNLGLNRRFNVGNRNEKKIFEGIFIKGTAYIAASKETLFENPNQNLGCFSFYMGTYPKKFLIFRKGIP